MDLGTAFAKLTLARGMVGVNHAKAVLRGNRDHLKAYRGQMMTDQDGKSLAALPGGEDMMVLGDVHQTITHEAPSNSSAPSMVKKLGTLAKLALGAGLIATGAGVGAGLPLILSALKPTAPASQQQSVDTDSDTTTDIRLWPESK